MRLPLRRLTEPRSPEAPEEAPEAPPRPPRGAPECAYAALLDGRTLWLAIATRPGTLVLRDTASGDVVPLVSDLVEDPTEHRSVRADLTTLPGQEEAAYDVVLVPSPGATPLPVWTPPLGDPGPVRVPAGEDGTQLALGRSGDGTLQVRRTRAEAGVLLDRFEVLDGAVVLHLVAGAGQHLVLVPDGEDQPVLIRPLEQDAEGVRATLAPADLPAVGDLMTRVGVGTPEEWLPVRRRRNDLANPGQATLLPALTDEDGRILLRLRWKPQGVLAARFLGEDGA